MNLRHPNLSAVINRYLGESSRCSRLKIGLVLLLSSLPFAKNLLLKITNADDRLKNLLAIMETPLGDGLLQMEEDLKKRLWDNGIFIPGNPSAYEKLFLVPLLIDFAKRGFENRDSKMIYSVRWKPMADQVRDVCLGIADYYRYKSFQKESPLFEIHPFMGLNPLIYNLDPDNAADNTLTLKQVLDKYFLEFNALQSSHDRRQLILDYDWTTFYGDINTLSKNAFLGIKVYPPTGFNPWPMNKQEEEAMKPYQGLDKLNTFYSYCVGKNIPITAHCSNGGFLSDAAFTDYANPVRWKSALDHYPDLRLNLAHFGYDDNDKSCMLQLFAEDSWRRTAADLACRYDNVYVDISYRGVDPAYYVELNELLISLTDSQQKKLLDKIIFGSDFMINLMSIDSYSEYMKKFQDSPLNTEMKDRLCRNNPERFLHIVDY
jgi:hypothetical protein